MPDAQPAVVGDLATAADAPFEAFQLDRGDGSWRLCIHHAPQGQATRGAVLHVPAFGEEMNKSRRSVALGARALSAAGFAVLQVDLLGCGDSDGDSGDADWQVWLEDLKAALEWLGTRHPTAALWLWSHRAGCLLAASLARQLGWSPRLLLWQPVLQGRSVVQQLLRLKAAAAWAEGNGKQVIDQAKADLAQGKALEVGGHTFSAGLMQHLEAAQFLLPAIQQPGVAANPVVWLEVGGPLATELNPAAQAKIASLTQAGYTVHSSVVQGPSFWQTTEIEEATELVAQTIAQVTQVAQLAQLAQLCSHAPHAGLQTAVSRT